MFSGQIDKETITISVLSQQIPTHTKIFVSAQLFEIKFWLKEKLSWSQQSSQSRKEEIPLSILLYSWSSGILFV